MLVLTDCLYLCYNNRGQRIGCNPCSLKGLVNYMKLRHIDYEVEVRPMVIFQVHDNEQYKNFLLMFVNQAREKAEGVIKVKNYYYDNQMAVVVDGDRTASALKDYLKQFGNVELVEVKDVYTVDFFGDIVDAGDADVEFLCPVEGDNFYKEFVR